MIVSQQSIAQALLSPGVPAPAGLSDPVGRSAGKRFDVYRNNVAVSLTEALETAFPVLAKLLGQENFRSMTGVYLRKHRPRSPLMMFYGEDMPGFLEAFEPTSSLGYLLDVARLELALRRSYHAADADPIKPERLQALPPERLMAATITLAPSMRILRSSWPVHAIWTFNVRPGSPKPEMAAEDVVIVRPDYDPFPVLLPAGAAAFLSSLAYGQSFASALDTATTEEPDFDLSAVLGLALSHGLLIEVKEPE